MTLLSDLRTQYPHAVCGSCEKEGCALRVHDLPPSLTLVIDCDKYRERSKEPRRLSDCFVFHEQNHELIVSVVELKGGRLDANHAISQIESGARVVTVLVDGHPVRVFLPILLHGKGLHTAEIKVLKSRKVELLGRAKRVIIKRCGTLLSEILEEHRLAYTLR